MRLRENRYLDQIPGSARVREQRDTCSNVLTRAGMLQPDDRILVELALKKRLTNLQLSQLLSVDAGTVSRRLHRIVNRLHDPVVVALIRPDCPLPPDYRQVALEHLLHGMTLRQIADRHLMRASQVRRMIEHVRGWHRGIACRSAMSVMSFMSSK